MSRSRRGLSRVRCDLGVCVEACEGVRRVAQLGTHRGARYGELEDWLGAQLHLLCGDRAWGELERGTAQNVWGESLGIGLGKYGEQQEAGERGVSWWEGEGRAGQSRAGRGGPVSRGGIARARAWPAPCRRSRASGWRLGAGSPPTQRAPGRRVQVRGGGVSVTALRG